MRQRERKILGASLAVSFLLHALALGAFQKYSLWFSVCQKVEESIDWLTFVDKQEKDQILKTAFEGKDKSQGTVSQTRAEKSSSLTMSSAVLETPPQGAFFTHSFWPQQELAASDLALPVFTLPSSPFNLLEYLPKDLLIPPPERKGLASFSPMAVHTRPLMLTVDSPVLEEPKTEPSISQNDSLVAIDSPQVGKIPSMIAYPDLPVLPRLSELNTASYSDSFDAELVFLPKEDESGYIFALTLIPRTTLEIPKMKRHITFLIDRSNSIQQKRLDTTKDAVLEALKELSPEDTFNIIAFDNKLDKLSPIPLTVSSQSMTAAEDFLGKIRLGSFFSTTDLYKPLFLILPMHMEVDETHSAILFTDGETLSRKNVQQSLVCDWTCYNSGKVSLYTFGMNDANSATLETLAAFNKGKHWYSSTTRGMKRKLIKLMRTIHSPIVKEISCKAISHLPQTKVRLLAKSSQMPVLCLDQPYVILGETTDLDDFILFVQGRLKDRWINVRKTVSFMNAKKGNKMLRQEWASQKALDLYERYLIEQDGKYLAEAKELLSSFELPMALQ